MRGIKRSFVSKYVDYIILCVNVLIYTLLFYSSVPSAFVCPLVPYGYI